MALCCTLIEHCFQIGWIVLQKIRKYACCGGCIGWIWHASSLHVCRLLLLHGRHRRFSVLCYVLTRQIGDNTVCYCRFWPAMHALRSKAVERQQTFVDHVLLWIQQPSAHFHFSTVWGLNLYLSFLDWSHKTGRQVSNRVKFKASTGNTSFSFLLQSGESSNKISILDSYIYFETWLTQVETRIQGKSRKDPKQSWN